MVTVVAYTWVLCLIDLFDLLSANHHDAAKYHHRYPPYIEYVTLQYCKLLFV